MTKTTARLPAPLSERLSSTSSALLSKQGREIDVAIGGIPFLLATDQNLPQSVETIPFRKEQLDVETDPGEQSLTNWWRRSQDSWHEGAGNLYQENRNNTNAGYGFYDSSGIDVWTQGQFSLLRNMKLKDSQAVFSRIKTYAVNGVRTNLCSNPNVETDLTGFVAGAGAEAAPTLTRDTTTKYSGTASVKTAINADDGAGLPPSLLIPHDNFTVGRTYTVSCYVYVPTGTVSWSLVAESTFGGSTGTTKDAWVRISHTFVATSTTSAVAIWPDTPSAAGESFYVDNILIEESPSMQPYFDGSTPGGAWNGVTNKSSSTETTTSTAASISAISSASLWTSTTDSGTFTALHTPAGKTLVDGFISGLYFYDVASDGTLYQGLVSAPGAATTWPCGTTPYRLTYGKARLWMIGGRKIWQPDTSLAGGTAQNPIFTHPNQGWSYTCMAEGPSAMYFGGHDGRISTIQAITLDSGGGIPTLSGASVTVALPDGELVQELAVIAGQYVGIGTNKGFRVGIVDNTNIVYGPLLFSPDGVQACTSIATMGSYFLVGFRTAAQPAELYRVDTSTQIADGIYPYARDAQCDTTGSVTSAAVYGTDVPQVLATTADGKAYYQSATELVSIGWLRTGRIRFRTNEKKLFKYVEVETEPLRGQLVIDGYEESGTEFDVATWADQGVAGSEAFAFTTALGAQRQIALKFTLTRDGTNSARGPVVNSYLVRALPSVKPQRMITLPLLCYDHEQGRRGMRIGYDGYCNERLEALQAIEDLGDTLVYQDFNKNSGQTVQIEALKFVQTSPPKAGQDSSGAGGILIAQLRTVSV